MKRAAFLLFVLTCASWYLAVSAAAQQTNQAYSSSYYIYKGDALRRTEGNPASAHYNRWQMWLYSQELDPSRFGTGLLYARWGVIEGPSAKAVMEQLTTIQQFERAYTSFFGANSWGRLTFSHPIGPVALAAGDGEATRDFVSKASFLNHQLVPLLISLSPSLRNNQPGNTPHLVQTYFQQTRDCLQNLARFYDRISRLPGEANYLNRELALLTVAVNAEQGAVQSVRAALPSVKLPVRTDWMKQSEKQGNEGTMDVSVQDVASGVSVQQSWSGGDGSMSGTVIATAVAYENIGRLEILAPPWTADQGWTLRIQSSNAFGFPQTVTSPERVTAKRVYAPVNLQTIGRSVYLVFSNPSDAQDAYAFFLYHQERKQ